MSALAEALLAAQRQAIGAASKAFVAGTLNESDLLELLDDIGARDTVEQGTTPTTHASRKPNGSTGKTWGSSTPSSSRSRRKGGRGERHYEG